MSQGAEINMSRIENILWTETEVWIGNFNVKAWKTNSTRSGCSLKCYKETSIMHNLCGDLSVSEYFKTYQAMWRWWGFFVDLSP